MHERLCVHPICFPNVSLPQLASNWRRLKAPRVGLISSWVEGDALDVLRDALQTGSHEVETINHAFLPSGHTLSKGKQAWEESRRRLNRVIDIAKTLGSRSIYTMTGGHGSLTWEEAADSFAEAIAPCVQHARAAGVQLLIECAPFVYADIHLAHSLRDAVTLAEIADLGVCFDFFASWTEAGLQQTIRRAAPRCHLVQVADYVYGDRSIPCRAVPGDGTIPVRRLIGQVLETGYGGAFDLELLGPRIDREGHLAAVSRSADYVGGILQSLGA